MAISWNYKSETNYTEVSMNRFKENCDRKLAGYYTQMWGNPADLDKREDTNTNDGLNKSVS